MICKMKNHLFSTAPTAHRPTAPTAHRPTAPTAHRPTAHHPHTTQT